MNILSKLIIITCSSNQSINITKFMLLLPHVANMSSVQNVTTAVLRGSTNTLFESNDSHNTNQYLDQYKTIIIKYQFACPHSDEVATPSVYFYILHES